MNLLGRFFWTLLTVLVIAVFGILWGAGMIYLSPGPLPQEITIVIPKGSSPAAMAQALRQVDAIHSKASFLVAIRLSGTESMLQAGEYALSAHISLKDLVALLKEGKSIVHSVTFPEGLTSYQIMDILNRTEILTGDIIEIPAEGSLLPETYQFTYGDTRQDVLNRMASAMKKTLQELWDQRDSDSPLKTPEEAITLASIVEKETGLATERPRVAGVFINRLHQGIPLQSDPTVIYAVTQGKKILERGLTRSELATPSPYNTYVSAGLPPGPIAHPGRASLVAVLHPEKHDFLYFVANGAGGHVFAATLSQHNKNVAAWRKVERLTVH